MSLIVIKNFWEKQSCGEAYAVGASELEALRNHAKMRYAFEGFIFDFAKFHEGSGKDVLEIGVGMGDDHEQWALSRPRTLVGVDLTERAIHYSAMRAQSSLLHVANAECLPLGANKFDLVYSWGVLHHTPDTRLAIQEILRVLRPGGVARIMIYSRHSIAAYLLFAVYGWLHRFSLKDTVSCRLESPGTQAFTVAEAEDLFHTFVSVQIHRELSPGDLLIGVAGQRHNGLLLRVARRLWPRRFIRRYFRSFGLFMLVEAQKPYKNPTRAVKQA